MEESCSVCGRCPASETIVFASVGGHTDLTGEIGHISGYSVSSFMVLCDRSECRTKAEEGLRGSKQPKFTVRT